MKWEVREDPLLQEYYRYNDESRLISPDDYIRYLRENVFKSGELDGLPKSAIILHDARIEEHMRRMGFDNYRQLETGTIDPNLVYVVKRNSGPDFILNRGLPGAGGISTQAAELYALGVEEIVHIGTCGLLGPRLKEGEIILSGGSYKDAAAVMLSNPDSEKQRINVKTEPSTDLTQRLKNGLDSSGIKYQRAVGFTSPIFYFQPEGLVWALAKGDVFLSGPIPEYVEMENSALFETAKLARKRAASMVVGSDRYVLDDIINNKFHYWGEKKLKHEFYDIDGDALKTKMMEIAINSFR
jgi:purine-nucleoside phosphorylase